MCVCIAYYMPAVAHGNPCTMYRFRFYWMCDLGDDTWWLCCAVRRLKDTNSSVRVLEHIFVFCAPLFFGPIHFHNRFIHHERTNEKNNTMEWKEYENRQRLRMHEHANCQFFFSSRWFSNDNDAIKMIDSKQIIMFIDWYKSMSEAKKYIYIRNWMSALWWKCDGCAWVKCWATRWKR